MLKYYTCIMQIPSVNFDFWYKGVLKIFLKGMTRSQEIYMLSHISTQLEHVLFFFVFFFQINKNQVEEKQNKKAFLVELRTFQNLFVQNFYCPLINMMYLIGLNMILWFFFFFFFIKRRRYRDWSRHESFIHFLILIKISFFFCMYNVVLDEKQTADIKKNLRQCS